MSSYQPASSPDRAKALAGVALVHAALGAIILSGLTVQASSFREQALKTFDIREAPPPPPPPIDPPRPDESSAAEEEAAPANIRSKPAPVVVPPPRIPLPAPQPVRTAEVRGPEGADRTAGASHLPGAGTGAGGEGRGFGGGGAGGQGAGSGAGFTPAQRVSRIPDHEYRNLVRASGRRSGSVGITLKVNSDGTPSNCRVARSSGDPNVDGLMCALALRHVRFRPARDPLGRPVAQDITWFPDWTPNR